MTAPPGVIIYNNDQFHEQFHNLDGNDIVCCRLRLAPGEEHILTDLCERGVTLIPSATAQLASRSKVHQARIFAPYMVPDTIAVYDTNQLLQTTSYFQKHGYSNIIVKQDRKNGGIGVHRFPNIEDVYNHTSFGNLNFPFVIQPFLESFRDIRVVILAEYAEAYERTNRSNFRQNIHCGGEAIPYQLNTKVINRCKEIMARGGFPYAHIDLMITPEEQIFLTEINLRGGLRGAAIEPGEYNLRIEEIHKRILAEIKG